MKCVEWGPGLYLEEGGYSCWVCISIGNEKGFGLLLTNLLVSLLSFPSPGLLTS